MSPNRAAEVDLKGAGLGLPGADPLVVEITRGSMVESRHLVDAVIADPDGAVVAAWGEAERAAFPRSACKPLQAIPLIESGAADAFGLDQRLIALACASHNGEAVHVEAALAWLDRLGLGDDDLECGGHLSRDPRVLGEFIHSGAPLRQVNNNCSGKHCGMLTHAVHLGDDHRGYVRADHAVQIRVTAALSLMYGLSLGSAAVGIDGCSIPTYAVPLTAMAGAMARLVAPDALPPGTAEACRRISAAMVAEPYMVAGRDRCCTDLMSAARGRVIAKTGAEGVYMAAVPGLGQGLALKVRDGAGRASECALTALLLGLGVLDDAARKALKKYIDPPVINVRGTSVGVTRTVPFHRQS